MVLVQLHRFHTDIGGRKWHMRYGKKITSNMTLKSFTVYTTVHATDSVIFITNMTLKPHNKMHLMFSLRPRKKRNA